MDAELSALAATAAATLVGLLTTDAWERVKGGLGALWRRVHPERAGTIEAEIAESRDELLALGAPEKDQLSEKLTGEWESRIYRLLVLNQGLAEPLHQLLEDVAVTCRAPDTLRIKTLEQHVKVSGHGRAYVVGQGEQWNVKR